MRSGSGNWRTALVAWFISSAVPRKLLRLVVGCGEGLVDVDDVTDVLGLGAE